MARRPAAFISIVDDNGIVWRKPTLTFNKYQMGYLGVATRVASYLNFYAGAGSFQAINQAMILVCMRLLPGTIRMLKPI